MDAEQERAALEDMVGEAYQALGAIVADTPKESDTMERLTKLLDMLSDPWAYIGRKK